MNGVEDTKLSLKDKEAGTYTVESLCLLARI